MLPLLSLSASALTLGSTYEPLSLSTASNPIVLYDAQSEAASEHVYRDAEQQYTAGRLMYLAGIGGLAASTALLGGGAYLANEMEDSGGVVLGVLAIVLGATGAVVSIPVMSGGALLVGRSTSMLDESASPLMGQLSIGLIGLAVVSTVVWWVDVGNPDGGFLYPVAGYLAGGSLIGALLTGTIQVVQSKRVWESHPMTLSLTPTLSADDLGLTATIRW